MCIPMKDLLEILHSDIILRIEAGSEPAKPRRGKNLSFDDERQSAGQLGEEGADQVQGRAPGTRQPSGGEGSSGSAASLLHADACSIS